MRTGSHEASVAKRLVALDLDDTLLLPDKTISPRVRAAVEQSLRHGVHVVLASARPLGSVARYAQELGIDGYCVALNGAIVARVPGPRVAHASILERSLVDEVLTACLDLGAANIFVETPYHCAVQRIDGEVSAYIAMTGSEPVYVGDLRRFESREVCKLSLLVEGPPDGVMAELRNGMGDRIHLIAWEGEWSWVEVLPEGTSKAAALEWLTSRLRIDRSEVLAVGDQLNDVEMLRWAGTGVAMGHGHPEAIAAADWVTASNIDDGCAIAIERFVFGLAPSSRSGSSQRGEGRFD